MAKARRASSRRTPSRASVDAAASEPPVPEISTIEPPPPSPTVRTRKKPAAPRAPKKPRTPAPAPTVEATIAAAAPAEVEPARLDTDTAETAKAEVLALLAESDQHPAKDAIETPTRYDVLPSLYARLEALVHLAESTPQEIAQDEAPFTPPDIAIFDPFEAADLAEEAPFDPPDESDLSASATFHDDAEFAEDEPERVAVVSEALAPVRTTPHVPNPPSRDYLERARRAAQDQIAGQPHRLLFGVPIEKIEHHKWRIAGAAIAPLLAAGAWALLAQSEGDREAALISPAQAAAMTPNARDLVGEYRLAMQRLESDRAREGVAVLRDLAEAGFPMAQYQLAKALERGEGATRSLAQARVWTERAASGGNCRAMHDVGVFYARGEGVARDEAMAARWFRAAAERGVADSQYNLGILFEQGRGVALNAEEALFWFLVAARNRDLNAIDRAVGVAAGLSSTEVSQVQARARSFQAQAADPIANGAFEGGAAQSCAAGG